MNSKKDIFATAEGKSDFIIALLVITVFAVFIYQFSFKNADEEVALDALTESDANQITNTPFTLDDKTQLVNINSNTYEATSIQTEDAYESEKNTAIVISDIKSSFPIEANSISKPVYNNNEAILQYEARKKAEDSIALVLKEKKPSTVIEKIPETSTVVPIEETKDAVKTVNCVVIVGVFKNLSNKAAIIKKLQSLGHSHTDGILREELSYVGVPVACDNEQERKELLRELNQAFGIDSWVKKL